jgi:hypothetical protein
MKGPAIHRLQNAYYIDAEQRRPPGTKLHFMSYVYTCTSTLYIYTYHVDMISSSRDA